MPATPTEFTLNADIFRLVADTADVGADMDMPPITGLELYFDPDLDPDADKLIPAATTPRPMFIKPERVTGYIRSNGRMYDQPAVSAAPADLTDPGNLGVRLLASGAELNLVTPLTYTVSSNTVNFAGGVKWGIAPWHIPAPTTDVTRDLAALAPVSQGSGQTVLQGPPGAGVDAVRLSGSNIIFSYQGVDLPVPLAIAPASVPDGSVTTAKMVDANVTLPKLSAPVQTSLGKADTAAQPAGDLSGSSAAPTVAKVNGVAVTGTPSAGQVPTATGAAAATWQTPSSALANGSVNTAAIIDANVTLAKLSSPVQSSLGKADTAAQPAGDLSGSAATPTVAKINGVAVTGTPTIGQVPTATGTAAATWQAPPGFGTNIEVAVHAATSKTPPVDADELALVDSAASFVLKKLTWANLKATLKTYLDSLTTTFTNKTIALGSNTVSGTTAQFNTANTDGDFATLAGSETFTGKTMALGSNTVSGTLAQLNTAVTDADLAALAGDLSGTAAAPTVSKINGVAVTGTPTAGQVPTATSGAAATWQAQVGSTAYQKPVTGIPETDMTAGVQTNLARAAASVQFVDLDESRLIVPAVVTGSYTLTVNDIFGVVEVDSPTAVNVTMPPNSAMPCLPGAWLKVRQVGVGAVTMLRGTGVSVNGPSSLTTAAQWCTMTLHKRSINGWVIQGDPATAVVPPPATTVAYGAVNAGANENAGDGIITWTHTAAVGDSIAFVDIAVGKGTGGAASTYTRAVTYAGQPMTSLGAVDSNNSTSGFVESFYIFNPATGSSTVNVTVTGGSGANPRTIIGGSVSYAGAGSLGTPVTGFTNTAGTPSVTVSSATSHLVHAAFCSGNTIASPTDTQRVLSNVTAINSAGNLLIEDQAGAASAVLGAATNSDNWAWIAVDLVPGTPAPPSLLPDIVSITPNPGPAGVVTVTGTNFLAGATLSFGGTAATSITVNSSTQITCTIPAHADGAVNVTVTTTAGTSDVYVFTYQAYTPNPAQIQKTIDFSTGNMNQWNWIDTPGYSGAPSGVAARSFVYSAQMVTDATAPSGFAFRVETRSGESRTELATNAGNNTTAGGGEGEIRWYEHGFRFDSTFPSNHSSLGWGLCTQYKSPGLGSPMVAWYLDRAPNALSLTITPQSGPAVYIGGQYSLYDITPLPRTSWVWVTLRILHSVSTSTGTIDLWVNQVRATFKDGTQTHHTATLMPNCDVQPVNSFVKQGYYRNPSIAATGIIYHSGSRACFDKTGLARPVTYP